MHRFGAVFADICYLQQKTASGKGFATEPCHFSVAACELATEMLADFVFDPTCCPSPLQLAAVNGRAYLA
jgi:hypothetical protein